MADNLVVVGKLNETGKVITVALKSSNSSGVMAAHDLTGYTSIKMQVETPGGTVVMNEVACVISGTATLGIITCTTDLTVAVHAGLIVSPENTPHRLEFSGLNAASKKRYWPLNKQGARTYGSFIIQNPLA